MNSENRIPSAAHSGHDQKAPLHQMIDNQLHKLDGQLIEALRHLKREIVGEGEPECAPKDDRPEPSLREVLVNAPERIATIKQVALKEIKDIRSHLFHP